MIKPKQKPYTYQILPVVACNSKVKQIGIIQQVTRKVKLSYIHTMEHVTARRKMNYKFMCKCR